jgi:phosphoglycolate phosphatase-like HAD superfamily hydrolase
MTRTQTLLACLVSIFCLMATASAQALPSWNDTPTKTAIISFVEKVTKEGSPDFVMPEDRIAVFDNDGTLWTEQPMYTQFAFIIDRVKAMAPDHPEWKDKEPFKSLLAGDAKGVAASGEKGLLELVAATHAGMTAEAFAATVTNWLKTAKHPKFNRSYLECVYQPQIELLQYLRDNGFQTFIVSGGGIDFMRPWTHEVYGIPPDQVVGSSGKTKYEVRDGEPVIVKLPEIDFIDDKAGKPVAIHKFIGKRPILAFGNSDGDFEMLEYVTTGSGPRLGLILHHDDAEREAAYDRESHVGKLARGLDEAQARGWVLVSMKSDWAVVFPRQ